MGEVWMKSRLDTLRMIFLVLFILATLVVSGLVLLLRNSFGHELAEPNLPVLTMVGSAATSIIALLGFIVTTVLSLRREKRETREFELALKQKEIELERARLELEQLKKQLEKKTK
jgi:predicted membrane protein